MLTGLRLLLLLVPGAGVDCSSRVHYNSVVRVACPV
jgi:hypothetical protein